MGYGGDVSLSCVSNSNHLWPVETQHAKIVKIKRIFKMVPMKMLKINLNQVLIIINCILKIDPFTKTCGKHLDSDN